MDIGEIKLGKMLKCSFKEDENIEVIMEGLNPDKNYGYGVTVIRVGKEDNEGWYMVPATIDESYQKIVFRSPPDGEYNEGLYFINRIEIYDNDDQVSESHPIRNREELNVQDIHETLFEVIKDSDSSKTCQEIKNYYDQIINNRESEFREGFGNGSNEYLGLIFVKDCKLTIRMRLGNYEVIPLSGISCFDEVNLIKSLLNANNINININYDEILNNCQNNQPSFLIHFPKVFADSIDEAISKCQERSQITCNLLAMERDAYPSIVGMALLNLNDDENWVGLNIQSYRGNLLGGSISGEEPQALKNKINKIKNNQKLQLYLSLYNDANKEIKLDFRYFRLWNLLEMIANNKDYKGRPRVDWQGTTGNDMKSDPITDPNRLKIKHAKELVFELIREAFNNYGLTDTMFSHNSNQGSIAEMIPIWYRHRNCAAHNGGCFHEDASYCKRNSNQFINCKNAHDEVWNIGDDSYFGALNTTVKIIINHEIAKSIV